MSNYSIVPNAALTATADAIREKLGTQETIAFDKNTGFKSAVEEISGGGGDSREDLTVPKDVDFIDFDGRLLYSYTAQEFLALTELPPNPSYPGLVAQGWNWALADAKEYVNNYGALVIGQSYITDDGKTRIYLYIDDFMVSHECVIQLTLGKNNDQTGAVNINWGDDTTELNSTFTATNTYRYFSHIYEVAGVHIIEIEVLNGTFSLGYPWSNTRLIGNPSTNNTKAYGSNSLIKVEIGAGFDSFGAQPFAESYFLQSVSIPTSIVGQGADFTTNNAFATSGHLKGIVFPNGFQGWNQNGMFSQAMQALKYIAIPKSMTKIKIAAAPVLRKLTMYALEPNSAGQSTISLGYARNLTHIALPGTYTTMVSTVQGSRIEKFTIPESVTAINSEALMYSYWLTELHVLPTTPPTMNNVRALNGLNSNAVIYVPYSSDHSILEAYKTATNWSTFASYMQEEPQ